MPINVTGKTVNICRQITKHATTLMASLESLGELNAQIADSSLDITTTANRDAIEAAADLMHAAPADYQAVQSSVAAVRAAINAGNHHKVFQKVRF